MYKTELFKVLTYGTYRDGSTAFPQKARRTYQRKS